MAGPLILKTNENPTFFNTEMVVGALIGNIPGALIGGWIGKERMERESRIGKIVGTPSLMNGEALAGGLLGLVAGAAIASAVALAGAPVTALIIGIAVITGGALLAGSIGKSRMEREYAMAQAQQIEQGVAVSHGVSQSVGTGKSYAARIEAERLAQQQRQR